MSLNKSMTLLLASIAVAGTILSSGPASAQVINHTGQISSLFLSTGNNLGFRVGLTLNGAPALPECPGNFVYVNVSHDNYQAYVATLTTLYAEQKSVAIEFVKDTNGYCQMLEFGTA